MKKGIGIFALCICAFLIGFGCGKKQKKQTAGKNNAVTMSVVRTEDDSIILACTIANKTKKDIVVGEEYSLQVLQDESFADVPLSQDAGAFNLSRSDILAGEEYTCRIYVEKNYGALEAGHYRIIKEYECVTKEDGSQEENSAKETVSAEFDL